MRALVAASVAMLALLLWLGYGRPDAQPEVLTHLYTPSFPAAPPAEPLAVTLAHLREELRSGTGEAFLRRTVPGQAGVLWLAIVLALVVAFDFERVRNVHNADIALLLAPGLLLFDVLRFFSVLQSPTYRNLLDLVFSALVAVSVAVIIRALWRAARPTAWAWHPRLSARELAALTLLLLTLNMMMALVRVPDDAGWFVNLSAQRLRERGRLPYGDPLLTGTPAAAYGPLLYAAHVPFQLGVAPARLNQTSSARPPLTPDAPYYLPPSLATKLCTIAFHLIAVVSLFVASVRLSGRRDVGWSMTTLYCGSAYVLGVGGDEYFIGGMTFVSHIAPAAVTLAAFAALPRPAWAGVLLAAGAGVGFYPVFLAPAWAAHWWHDRRGLLRFLAGFALAAMLIGAWTWTASRPADGRSRIGTILHDTLGHHTDPGGYGSSPFGFWGQRGGIRAWMMRPLVGESALTSPAHLVFFLIVMTGGALTRNGSARTLALVTAAVASASSLLKVHPTGTYVAWYYGFLLLGFLAADAAAPAPGARPAEHDRVLPQHSA